MALKNPQDVSGWTDVPNGDVWTPRRSGNLISRAILQLEQQLQRTRKKPSVVSTGGGKTTIISAGLPLQVLSVAAVQTASKQQDRTFSLVTVSFTRNPGDTNFAGARVWFKGLKGSTQWELVASGANSPISFLEEATGETVQVAVQAFNASNVGCDFNGCPITTVKLSGVVSAPPAPVVSQNVTPVVGGFQFTFTLEAGLLADVIDCYKVYRNTANNSGSASVCQTIKHPQSNNGSFVVQDYPGGDSVYFYWVSAVNTVGLESSLTAAQSSTQNALATQKAFGKNLVPNPGFETNTVGPAAGTAIALNYPVCDGWLLHQNDNSLFTCTLDNTSAHSGTQSVKSSINISSSVPANTTNSGTFESSAALPLAINDIVRASGWYTFAQGGAPPAGLTVRGILGINIYSNSGTLLGSVSVTITGLQSVFTFVQAALKIPATLGGQVPSYGKFFVAGQVQNTTGSPVSTGAALIGDFRYDDVRCVIQNTAFDLTPLNTQGLPQTNGKILTQATTTTTINVAAFTMQYGDGTIAYSSGSVNPGSLGTWYIYFLDPTYSGGAVTYLATNNAYITTSDNGAIVIGQITTTSAGSQTGGSGGGGTTISICFSPNTRLLSGKEISRTQRGDYVWVERDNGDRVLRRIANVIVRDYDGPVHDMGDGELVTPTHEFRDAGGWVQAKKLFPRVGHYSGKVYNLHIDTTREEERNYVLHNGRCAHNIRPGGTC